MINGFAIILEDKVLYCSNDNIYSSFEIILFIEKLISSINPSGNWRLNNIYLKGYRMTAERLLIRHDITEDGKNLFFCFSGDFSVGSKIAPNVLREFCEKVESYYKTSLLLERAAGKDIFKEIIETATDYLWDAYEDQLENEGKMDPEPDPSLPNNLLYCGISSQGLPIISQLYSKLLLENIGKEINQENVELYSSNLSAKLATISMNTVIRAKTSIKEIVIKDINDGMNYFIFFGDINNFSLDFFGSGNYAHIKGIFKRLKKHVASEPILHEDFTGTLKPYKYLHDKIQEFYESGY